MDQSTTTTTTTIIAIPGQLLGPSSKYQVGPGTHIHESNIYASILGPIQIMHAKKPVGPTKRPTKITPMDSSLLPTISISREMEPQVSRGTVFANKGAEDTESIKKELLPEVNSIVLCRVTRIMPRQAVVSILVLGEHVLDGDWQGLIRVQDVRATEKDKVKIFECFRPGDIVRAQVISLGDQASYYLSTSSNQLGVVMATSEAGNAMHPVNWKEYRDPLTGLLEKRKVARPSG